MSPQLGDTPERGSDAQGGRDRMIADIEAEHSTWADVEAAYPTIKVLETQGEVI